MTQPAQTPDDLSHNRRGVLSPAQARWIRELSGGGLFAAAPSGDFAEDLAEGRVVALSGEVVWDTTTVHVRVGSQQHSGPFTGLFVRAADGRDCHFLRQIALLPGPYGCYVLPRSRFVVATELQGTGAEHCARLRALLCERQRLSEAALADNRAGRISPDQHEALVARARSARRLALGVLVGPPIVFAGVLAMIGPLREHPGDALLFLGVLAAMLAVPALAFFIKGRRFLSDVAEGRPTTYEGPVTVETEEHGDDTHRAGRVDYYVRVGGVKLKLEPGAVGQVLALFTGYAYRVSYAPRSRTVLSVDLAG